MHPKVFVSPKQISNCNFCQQLFAPAAGTLHGLDIYVAHCLSEKVYQNVLKVLNLKSILVKHFPVLFYTNTCHCKYSILSQNFQTRNMPNKSATNTAARWNGMLCWVF